MEMNKLTENYILIKHNYPIMGRIVIFLLSLKGCAANVCQFSFSVVTL